jgi:hypothetical protein
MTRRLVDSSMWQNEKFATLPAMARLLQIGMINHADDQGRGKAHPSLLRAQVFPYDDVTLGDVAAWLELIKANGTILLYSVDGKDYYQMCNWWEYQAHQYAMPSDYPKPAGWSDRIRKTFTKGQIVTCNWILSNGTRSPDTCDELGRLIQVNNQVNIQDKDKDKDKDHVSSAPAEPAAKKPKSSKSEKEKAPTEQNELFGAVCACVGWDHKTITEKQAGQVAQTMGVLKSAGYTIADLRTFWRLWHEEDWRGQKGQFPTLSQLRSDIGKIRAVPPSSTSPNGTVANFDVSTMIGG